MSSFVHMQPQKGRANEMKSVVQRSVRDVHLADYQRNKETRGVSRTVMDFRKLLVSKGHSLVLMLT